MSFCCVRQLSLFLSTPPDHKYPQAFANPQTFPRETLFSQAEKMIRTLSGNQVSKADVLRGEETGAVQTASPVLYFKGLFSMLVLKDPQKPCIDMCCKRVRCWSWD